MDRFINIGVRTATQVNENLGQDPETFISRGNIDLESVVFYYETFDQDDKATGTNIDTKYGVVGSSEKYDVFHKKITEYRQNKDIDLSRLIK